MRDVGILMLSWRDILMFSQRGKARLDFSTLSILVLTNPLCFLCVFSLCSFRFSVGTIFYAHIYSRPNLYMQLFLLSVWCIFFCLIVESSKNICWLTLSWPQDLNSFYLVHLVPTSVLLMKRHIITVYNIKKWTHIETMNDKRLKRDELAFFLCIFISLDWHLLSSSCTCL